MFVLEPDGAGRVAFGEGGARVGRAHAETFDAVRSATSMVEVRRLIEDWMLVEIEADAYLGG